MKELTDCVKGYVIPHEAWYGNTKGMAAVMQCPQTEVECTFNQAERQANFYLCGRNLESG